MWKNGPEDNSKITKVVTPITGSECKQPPRKQSNFKGGAASACGTSVSMAWHCLPSQAPRTLVPCSLATPGEVLVGSVVRWVTVATPLEGVSSKLWQLQCGIISPSRRSMSPVELDLRFKNRAAWSHRCATQAQNCFQMGSLQRNIMGARPRNRGTLKAGPPKAGAQGCPASYMIRTATLVCLEDDSSTPVSLEGRASRQRGLFLSLKV